MSLIDFAVIGDDKDGWCEVISMLAFSERLKFI